MNNYLNALKNDTNYTLTENGAITHKTTFNKVLDMFAMGGSMRNRSENDITNMFFQAYSEDKDLALKCLFYLRDCRGKGQGERRFFRICIKWLANFFSAEMNHLIPKVAEYGRYDDLFELFDTSMEEDMMNYVKKVIDNNEDHLIYKWMPSINASSSLTKERGRRFARFFKMTEPQYRHMLSEGREACHLVETLMSQNRWDKIAFDKLPSKAGLLYKNAFMRREETKERYAEFMANKTTKVNAGVLTPVDIAHQIFNCNGIPTSTARLAWQKYWDALPDYYNGKEEPGIAVVDVSGSMYGRPMEAAVSMGAYIAERGKGPFKDHFITFSAAPRLVEFSGVDIYHKFKMATKADWGYNTNIEAVFELLLNTALNHKTAAADMPKTLYIFSDMEFDHGLNLRRGENELLTLIESIERKWKSHGYELPNIIFWNLDARQDNIPALGSKFSYVSGFSMNMVENILGGKTGISLMLEKLLSERYSPIKSIYGSRE